jgi:uncharacterized membrane protein YgcG
VDGAARMCEGIRHVLAERGLFIQISFAQPHFRTKVINMNAITLVRTCYNINSKVQLYKILWKRFSICGAPSLIPGGTLIRLLPHQVSQRGAPAGGVRGEAAAKAAAGGGGASASGGGSGGGSEGGSGSGRGGGGGGRWRG